MNQRADGRWIKAVTINGQRKYFYSTAKTEKQAEKDIANQMLEYDAKLHREKHNFKDLAEQMLEIREKTVSTSTLECYRYSLKHLERFYDTDMEDITPSMLQSLLNEMATKKYTQSAISKTKIIFGLVLDFAVLKGLNINNFIRSIKVPRVGKSKITAPDDAVITKIKNSTGVEYSEFAQMLLYTGMRRGEIVALQRKDIDLEKGVINVWRSVEYLANQPNVKDMPKTINSVRSIPILNDLLPVAKKLCKGLTANDFIFGKEKPLTATMVNKRWKKYVEQIGCPDLNMHQLRHAYAKILYRAGIDVKTAQGLLGHADITTTMNIYTDFSEDVVTRSMDKVNEFMANSF